MNSREKFNAVMNFDDNSPNMKAEFGYWAGTIRTWFDQGLPRLQDIPDSVLDGELVRGTLPLHPEDDGLIDRNVLPYFKLDSYLAKFPFDISPRLGLKIIKEDSKERIYIDKFGITNKVSKGMCRYTYDPGLSNKKFQGILMIIKNIMMIILKPGFLKIGIIWFNI